ncbi:MAG: ABC transporter permease [Pseudomonadota bacterium]
MAPWLNTAISIAFDGLAYGMILFIISVGLSVTMGLMGFVNLAHGVFAMVGGYAAAVLVTRFGLPFPAALPAAALAVGLASIVLERLVYAPLYSAGELEQVLVSIGLVFMAVAVVTFVFGPAPMTLPVPAYLKGQIDLGFRAFPTYRFLMICVGLGMIGALWFAFERTQLGACIRAAVDNRRMAQSLGINVERLFTLTFALGSGLAALGGALAVDIVGLSPSFAFQYLVYFLVVVAVGGLGSIQGAFYAALLLGTIDNAGKYLWPAGGAFFIYVVAVAVLLVRPSGLFGRAGEAASGPRGPAPASPAEREAIGRRHRWRPVEALPWLLAVGAFFVFPGYMALGTQVLIYILFALSLDLVVGYAGIVTLGHAAFFGTGAYAAGILAARYGWQEPVSGLLAGGLAAGVAGLASGWVLLRYHGLALLMLTMATAILLHEFANVGADLTGGFDGLLGIANAPLLGRFDYDLWGHTHYGYALAVLFICFLAVRRISHSSFGRALVGIRENMLRMHAIGSRVHLRLVIVYAISAAIAGIAGALFAQTNAYVTLEVLGFVTSGNVLIMLVLGGMGRLYGAFLGAALYVLLRSELAKASPEFWELGVGLVLVLAVLFARGGLLGLTDLLARRLRRGQA